MTEEDVEQQEKRVKRIRQRELNDIKKICELKEGRRFMWRLLIESGFFQEAFFGNSRDIYEKGKRAIGSFIHRETTTACGFGIVEKMFLEWSSTKKQEEEQ